MVDNVQQKCVWSQSLWWCSQQVRAQDCLRWWVGTRNDFCHQALDKWRHTPCLQRPLQAWFVCIWRQDVACICYAICIWSFQRRAASERAWSEAVFLLMNPCFGCLLAQACLSCRTWSKTPQPIHCAQLLPVAFTMRGAQLPLNKPWLSVVLACRRLKTHLFKLHLDPIKKSNWKGKKDQQAHCILSLCLIFMLF